jgi:hypothetical protein
MKWSVHPARENMVKTIVSLVFIIAFLVYVSVFFGVVFVVVGFIILFVSLHSYYFPTHYEITDTEIIVTKFFGTQRRLLKEFRMVYEGKNGMLLSPFRRKTFLNQFRGVFVLVPREQKEIVEDVRQRIATQQNGEVETGTKGGENA